MNRKEPLRAVKGMRDILPPESALWEEIEQAAREVFRAYAYREIRTPLVEPTELFARGVGQDTDIVTKEMYSWEDYESQPLSIFRKGILSEGIFGTGPSEFREVVRRFLEYIDAGLRNDIVPKNAENLKSIANLRLLYSGLPDTANPFALAATATDFEKTKDAIKAATLLLRLGPELTLRPEATASVVRAYIEHKMHEQPGVKKFYYLGPMFRRERPQKGRYRQFYQIGAEAIGSESPAVDAEVLEMLIVLLGRLRLTGFTVLLNSVGCSQCRPQYLAVLRSELSKVRQQLCADCQRRSETNPLRVLDCKVPEDQPIIAALPTFLDLLCAECRKHFEQLQGYLRDRQIPFTLQPRLVRGLDYYTRTTFEIAHGALGAQNSVLGGGRYDGLSEMLGGPPAPGIGFSIGEDRLALTLSQPAESEQAFEASELPLYIIWLGESAYRHAAELARELRARNVAVDLLADPLKLKKALEVASRLRVRHVLIVGDQELAEGKYPLRDMAQGKQKTMTKEELFAQFAGEESAEKRVAPEPSVRHRSPLAEKGHPVP